MGMAPVAQTYLHLLEFATEDGLGDELCFSLIKRIAYLTEQPREIPPRILAKTIRVFLPEDVSNAQFDPELKTCIRELNSVTRRPNLPVHADGSDIEQIRDDLLRSISLWAFITELEREPFVASTCLAVLNENFSLYSSDYKTLLRYIAKPGRAAKLKRVFPWKDVHQLMDRFVTACMDVIRNEP